MSASISKISAIVDKKRLALRKSIWRRFNNYAPEACATFIFGAQRSGTTLLLACLDESMQIEVFGEESRAMTNYRIRPDAEIQSLVTKSRHKAVVFKPLTDSHRARHFLSLCESGRGIWAYRKPADRAYSAVQKFGDHNLQVLGAIARGEMLDSWQAQGLNEEELAYIRSFDWSRVSPHTAAAIFWLVRNRIFFNNDLQNDKRVLPVAYEDIVATPQASIAALCKFIGCDYDARMIRHVHARSIGRQNVEVSPEVAEKCDAMYERLQAVQEERWRALQLQQGEV